MPESNLFNNLERLIDGWCDRRALGPLRQILPAYPLHTPQTDGWFDLYKALKDIKVFCKDELLPDEKSLLQTLMIELAEILDKRMGSTTWHV